jgi:hypothetical protein
MKDVYVALMLDMDREPEVVLYEKEEGAISFLKREAVLAAVRYEKESEQTPWSGEAQDIAGYRVGNEWAGRVTKQEVIDG